jgi:hypothetical protein
LAKISADTNIGKNLTCTQDMHYTTCIAEMDILFEKLSMGRAVSGFRECMIFCIFQANKSCSKVNIGCQMTRIKFFRTGDYDESMNVLGSVGGEHKTRGIMGCMHQPPANFIHSKLITNNGVKAFQEGLSHIQARVASMATMMPLSCPPHVRHSAAGGGVNVASHFCCLYRVWTVRWRGRLTTVVSLTVCLQLRLAMLVLNMHLRHQRILRVVPMFRLGGSPGRKGC